MRIRGFVLSLLGIGATALAISVRRARGKRAESLIPGPDPKDPVQSFDDVVVLHEEELAVDAMPHVEVDRTQRDDDAAEADGENWVEALLEDSTEDGPEPGLELTDGF